MWNDRLVTPEDLPSYSELILPAIRAVAALGGSAQGREVSDHVLGDLKPTDEMLSVMYPNRPEVSVLIDRIWWGRSYAKLIGALESPKRGVFLLTPLGKELLALPADEARRRTLELDREYRRTRPRKHTKGVGRTASPDDQPDSLITSEELPELDETPSGSGRWQDVLLRRLHLMKPEAFEEFVLYVLRLYGLELEHVGGSGDEGIDGIGTAPISPVLSSRVAVQIKRYDPSGKAIARDVVALFQRDAQSKGAERAILVTLGRYSEPARKAATAVIPTVDLIDGERLAQLLLDREIGVKLAPQVDPDWFDRFD